MSIYDVIINKISKIQEKSKVEGPVTNISASSMLTAEITLISSFLVALIMLRLLNPALMIVLVIALFVIFITLMPIMPKLRKEQSDSFNIMIFYVILALGIVITLFYWGINYV
jgi:energy-converting hydrogenase B subunit G